MYNIRRIVISPVVFLILAVSLSAANRADSQTVRIQNGEGAWGYGWMFSHAGNCFAVLPEHVAGIFPKITVTTAAPVVIDQGTIVKPFWPGLDLAVAVLDRGPLDQRCTAKLDELRPTNATRNPSTALLLRITPSGEEVRLPIRILDRDYLQFTGELLREADAIGQGTSGSFAFVDGSPIGMAITSDDVTRATFIRSEEIAINIERYLSEQGRAFVAEAAPKETSPRAGLVLHSATANTVPILPQFAPENLLTTGLFVTQPNGPVILTFQTVGPSPATISRLRMTAPSDGDYTFPKAVTVYLDSSEKGDRFRLWTRGEMRPDGLFDTGALAVRNARWLRVVIQSAWGEGAIAIDQVIAE